MKSIVTAEEMRAMERAAFAAGVSPLLLMEYAARGVTAALEERLGGLRGKRPLFVCGGGNNGGDGWAAARMTLLAGAEALVWEVLPPKTDEAQENKRYYAALGGQIAQEIAENARFDAVIDCVFGTGLARAPEGKAAEAIEAAARMDALRVAVDVPSGMDATTGRAAGACFRADLTVTLGYEKIGLYLTRRRELVGDIFLAPLPLPRGIEGTLPCPPILAAEGSDLFDLIPPRAVDANKGDCGRILLYCGSLGMAGAAAMAAKGALRAGAGLVTVACPADIIPILQTLVPNAMCLPVERAISEKPPRDALLIGCGLPPTDEAWRNILSLYNESVPTVWDAGALTLLAQNPMTLNESSVLTPHPGEAARLLNVSVGEVLDDPLAAAKAIAQTYHCRVALKNAVTVIAAPDGNVRLNTVGTPALAKGGSGDGLAGILAAFIAQPCTHPLIPLQAACLAQGLAARRAEKIHGTRGLLTGEWLDVLEL